DGREILRYFQFEQVHREVRRSDHGRAPVLAASNGNGSGANHFAGGSTLFDRGEAPLQMQRAGASVVVETIRGVGLLLRLHDYGAGSERMHRAGSYVNHLALIDVDPVELL